MPDPDMERVDSTSPIAARGGMDSRSRLAFWLFLAAFVLHELEEWNLVAWQIRSFSPEPGFSAHQARVLLVAFALLGFCFAAPCIHFLKERAAYRVLLPLFVVPILANALSHITWLVLFRSYAPGVVTAGLLLTPTGGYLLWSCARRRHLPRAVVVLLALLTLAPVIAVTMSGRTLSRDQIELQEIGGRIADAICPAEP